MGGAGRGRAAVGRFRGGRQVGKTEASGWWVEQKPVGATEAEKRFGWAGITKVIVE